MLTLKRVPLRRGAGFHPSRQRSNACTYIGPLQRANELLELLESHDQPFKRLPLPAKPPSIPQTHQSTWALHLQR
jgi:hypothetical protein